MSRTTEPQPAALDEVFERSAELTCAVHANVIIIVWHNAPTRAPMLRVESYLDAYLPRARGKMASVVVADFARSAPTERDVLQIHARMTKKFERYALGIALVVDGSTALKTVVRFVLSTLQLMSSTRFQQKVFESAVSAATWLATLDTALDQSKLLAAIDEARRVELTPAPVLSAR